MSNEATFAEDGEWNHGAKRDGMRAARFLIILF